MLSPHKGRSLIVPFVVWMKSGHSVPIKDFEIAPPFVPGESSASICITGNIFWDKQKGALLSVGPVRG